MEHPKNRRKRCQQRGKEGLSSPPPDCHNIFFSSSFEFRAVYDLSVSQNHLAGSSKAKKNGQKKMDCKCINHDCFNLGRCRQRNQWTYGKTSSVNLVCTSVLVCACSVWLLDVHRLLCGIPTRNLWQRVVPTLCLHFRISVDVREANISSKRKHLGA